MVRFAHGEVKYKSAAKRFNSASGALKMGNGKFKKGRAVIAGITMAPADRAGVLGKHGQALSVCPFAARAGCKKGCLDDAGRAGSPIGVERRRRMTVRWWTERDAFLADFETGLEILAEVKRQDPDVEVGFRGNVMSDIRWEKFQLPRSGLSPVEFAVLHRLRMYDYTKWPTHLRPDVGGYKLTRSFSQHLGVRGAADALLAGGNVAMIFEVKKSGELPTEWNGFPVMDGDKNDERWTDPPGTIVGLRLKGSHRIKDELRRIGMVIDPATERAVEAAA